MCQQCPHVSSGLCSGFISLPEVKFLLCHWLLVLGRAKHGLAVLLIPKVILNPQSMS